MTVAFSSARTIDRPVGEVWRQLTDWNRAARWLGVDSIHADGPPALGTAVIFRTRGRERRSQIVSLDPGRSVTLRSRQGGVVADYTYSVRADGDRSRVTLVADVRTSRAWALLGPLIRAAIRRADAGQLDALDREITAA